MSDAARTGVTAAPAMDFGMLKSVSSLSRSCIQSMTSFFIGLGVGIRSFRALSQC